MLPQLRHIILIIIVSSLPTCLLSQSYTNLSIDTPNILGAAFVSSCEYNNKIVYSVSNSTGGLVSYLIDCTNNNEIEEVLKLNNQSSQLIITDMSKIDGSENVILFLHSSTSSSGYQKRGYVILNKSLNIEQFNIYQGLEFTYGIYSNQIHNHVHLLFDEGFYDHGGNARISNFQFDEGLQWSVLPDLNLENDFPVGIYYNDDSTIVQLTSNKMISYDEDGRINESYKIKNYSFYNYINHHGNQYVLLDSGFSDDRIFIGKIDNMSGSIKIYKLTITAQNPNLFGNGVISRMEYLTDSSFYFDVGNDPRRKNSFIVEFNTDIDKVGKIFQFPGYTTNTSKIDVGYSYNRWEGGIGVLSKSGNLICEMEEVCWTLEEAGQISLQPIQINVTKSTSINEVDADISFDEISFSAHQKCREIENPDPSFDFIEDEICIGESIIVDPNTIDSIGGSDWLLINNAGDTLNHAEGKEISFSCEGMRDGSYRLVHNLFHLGCRSTATDTFYLSSTPSAAINGPDTLCPGEQTELTFSTEGSAALDSLRWFKGSSPLSTNQNTLTVDVPGRYSVAYYRDWCSDTVFHEVASGPEVGAVEISGPPTACEEEGLTLTAGLETQIDGPISYEWNTGAQSPSIEVAQSGTYVVTVPQRCGTSTDSVTVTLENCSRDLYFPNVFTPNGDGVNDTWHPLPTEDWSFDIQIFNVSGNRVYECRGLDCAWDGIFEGDPLNPGVFLYHVIATHEDGTEREYRGDVTLVR